MVRRMVGFAFRLQRGGGKRSSSEGCGLCSPRTVMDSGACVPVAPQDMLPRRLILETDAIRSGKTFNEASGHEMKRHGEQRVHVITDNGMSCAMSRGYSFSQARTATQETRLFSESWRGHPQHRGGRFGGVITTSRRAPRVPSIALRNRHVALRTR